MAKRDGGTERSEESGEMASLQQRVQSLERDMSTLLLRFGEQEQELLNLSQIVMAMQSGDAAPAPAAAPPTAELAPRERVALSPAMGSVLKLIVSGQAEAAKKALGGISADERNAQPAVLAVTAGALCIGRADYANARTALDKARQLTDDPRLLRIVEMVAARVPEA
jgi:hypothetical protein